MTNLLEYQEKQLHKEQGVSVPNGGLAESPLEAFETTAKIIKPVFIKAQIGIIGRFQIDGIKFVNTGNPCYDDQVTAK